MDVHLHVKSDLNEKEFILVHGLSEHNLSLQEGGGHNIGGSEATGYLLTHPWIRKQGTLVGSKTASQPTCSIQTPSPKSSPVSRNSTARWDPRRGIFYPYLHRYL